MKSFSLHHTFPDHFAAARQKLLPLLSEVVAPDAIFLLGASLYRRRTESIFSIASASAKHLSDYFLLLLISDTHNKPLYEWQDQIEQHARTFATVTVIVLETITFQQWLNACHPFAVSVAETSVPIFKKENLQLSATANINADQHKIQQNFKDSVAKSKSFLAGADLYLIRKEYKQAAFMIHQAAEQALSNIIKTGTGYHTHTHNIERLFRYSSMVCYQIPDIFPRNTDREKQLFKLLQNAYSDARYSELYTIGYKELHLLMERVKEIVAIMESLALPTSDQY